MAIVDEFKSEKNRGLIIQASTKMLFDKYKLSLNADVLVSIINAIISSMSKDAILMNNTIKLMELNTITLAKMKDYITKNIDSIRNDGIIADGNMGNGNMVQQVQQSTVQQVQQSEENISNIATAATAATTAMTVMPVMNEDPYNAYKEDYTYNKGDILSNEELLIRVKEYENNRAISNTILANMDATRDAGANIDSSSISLDNRSASSANATNIIPEIMEKVLTSINTNANTFVNKKTLIINSFSRDWINNSNRNQLSFTINIDLQSNIIEPLKILFPKYVKDRTPYIVLVITDNHKTFKYNFLYSKSAGKWDIWKLINKDNNINNNINLTNKNWRINFLDYLNNELNLGKDNIKISQINDYRMDYDNNTSIETNIDNILIPQHNLTKEAKNKRLAFYEINIDYSNQLEYDEYNLDILSKYDNMLLKTYNNNHVNIKVLEVNNDLGKIIILNETNLMKDDFVNSSLLNYGAQYSLILTYYPIRNM
uniref:Uncharacterized protein n=1 Tax=viral metagenome TaxID=1070528 RepID=A0A6C0LAH7_9ZZZZ